MSYEDAEFPPAQSSIGPEGFCEKEIAWSRPGQTCSLFGGKISADDVLEGELDDCERADLARHSTSLGAPACAGGGGAAWKWTTESLASSLLDDLSSLTAGAKVNDALFCRQDSLPSPDACWVQIVEKAFAKTFGSYSALGGGNTAEALHDLTGRSGSTFGRFMELTEHGRPVFDYNMDATDVKLVEHLEEKGLVACAFFKKGKRQPPEDRHGLIQNHAYW
eukprot:767855-Hanusia_phi.AAC.1